MLDVRNKTTAIVQTPEESEVGGVVTAATSTSRPWWCAAFVRTVSIESNRQRYEDIVMMTINFRCLCQVFSIFERVLKIIYLGKIHAAI